MRRILFRIQLDDHLFGYLRIYILSRRKGDNLTFQFFGIEIKPFGHFSALLYAFYSSKVGGVFLRFLNRDNVADLNLVRRDVYGTAVYGKVRVSYELSCLRSRNRYTHSVNDVIQTTL